jgi:hypothetical protein
MSQRIDIGGFIPGCVVFVFLYRLVCGALGGGGFG